MPRYQTKELFVARGYVKRESTFKESGTIGNWIFRLGNRLSSSNVVLHIGGNEPGVGNLCLQQPIKRVLDAAVTAGKVL